MSPTILTIATRNAHKAQEIAAMLPPHFTVRTLADYPELPDVEETGTTFAENAALKACGISAALPGMVLADDSGLCVDALGGAPGVYSARYAGEHGNDAANNAKLLADLAALPATTAPAARFMCAMYLAEGGQIKAEFIGKVEGHITASPAGEHGFGYDPLFVPAGYTCTMAELAAEQKNRISHRADALRQFLAYITS
ncbi:MAG: RdgB/HAM1 family non-canonical purine NTP pyrophosphatase [Akkermansiaceae bacterium]|nr:RdgB/HAM1 family non-canonical purine NTP pyrophosphatase [Akkermansiaceae bacterium]